MADIVSNEFISQLEQEESLDSGFLTERGFEAFKDTVHRDVPESEREIVYNVIRRHLRRAIKTAQHREERRVRQRPYQHLERSSKRSGPTRGDIQRAMKLARKELLSPRSEISASTKSFIEEHCPCG